MKTPRENLLAAVNRNNPEKVPIHLTLCPSQIESFKARFGHDDYQSWFNVPVREVGLTLVPRFSEGVKLYDRETLPPETRIDVWGVAHSKGSKEAQHMTRMHHPLKGPRTLKEIEQYPLPELADNELTRYPKAIREIQQKGLAAKTTMACTVWEVAWYIRSMDDLFVDMAQDDPNAEILFERITELSCRRAAMIARGGADILGLGDDIGMQHSIMMSVPMWEKWIKGRLARIIAAAKKENPEIRIWYHSCGYIIPFIEGLIEAGVEILNPVQPEAMSFEEVYKIARGRLSFWGTVGTQTTMPFGTPEDVRRAVRSVIHHCGARGGIVIAPTHLVEPEVPWENLLAMKEEAER